MKSLKPFLNTLIICLVLSLCACGSTAGLIPIPIQTHPLEEGETLTLDVAHGAVEIQFTARQDLQLNGSILPEAADALTVAESADGLQITFTPQDRQSNPIHLQLALPKSTSVVFETYNAALSLSGEEGEIDATTMGGDVLLDGFSGQAVIKANRGDVQVKASSGAISVFANYGDVHFEDAHGQISVVNILGAVVYSGRPEVNDVFNLQTDHGPVDFSVPADANLTVAVQTSSGWVTCMPQSLSTTSRTCDGNVGTGGAALAIRTVSGKIKLWVDPLLP
jgi:hypothetical protein